MGPGEVIKIVIVSVIIIFAAYYSVYFLAARKSKQIGGRDIRVCERFSLSKDKMICVIESKGKAYLTVITSGGATVLDTYDIPEPDGEKSPAGTGGRTGVIRLPDMIGRGFSAVFGKRGSDLKTGDSVRRARVPDYSFGLFMKRAEAGETIGAYAEKDGEKHMLKTAAEEDKLDEVYRKIQKRRAESASAAHREEKEPPDE